MFPSNILANFFGFEEAGFFEVDEEEAAVPKIDFLDDNPAEARKYLMI